MIKYSQLLAQTHNKQLTSEGKKQLNLDLLEAFEEFMDKDNNLLQDYKQRIWKIIADDVIQHIDKTYDLFDGMLTEIKSDEAADMYKQEADEILEALDILMNIKDLINNKFS
jgi:histidyl-tRNA synthetase